MARRTIKIPQKDYNDNKMSKEEELDDVLTTLDSIHSKHQDTSPRNSLPITKIVVAGTFISIIILGIFSLGNLSQEVNSEDSITGSLDFKIQLLNSSEVMLSDFIGEPIILEFMTSWCDTCKIQNEELKAFNADFSNIHILSVSVDLDDSITQLINYKNNYGITWTMGRDINRQGAKLFDFQHIPTVAFFDSAGILRHKKTGVASYDNLVEWFNEL
ncbi:MAG: TlpA family protein disulfide reductase [Candidatus Hodarchaeales archaeon]|jgi:thiol-disulfide isomerase/thioredoxin